jgi:putative nucleotidyltransferase with HDIG domain
MTLLYLFRVNINNGVKAVRKIPVKELAKGMVLDQDVFLSKQCGKLLMSRDTILTDRQIELLKKHGIANTYVAGGKEPERIMVKPPRPTIPPLLRESILQILADLFDFFRHDEQDKYEVLRILKQLDVLVDQLVKNLQGIKNTQVHISDLKSYDEYTYHHSLSVAVLSIAIGQALGLEEGQLHVLGKCALMHDIGKVAIPEDILNKPTHLSIQEFNIIKRHSPEGYQFLSKYEADDPVLLSAVLYHHERYDGNGYPYGLKGDKIPLFSRIIAVADVYDALTSHRTYRKPESPGEAVEYIMGNVGAAFDHDIICAMLNTLELYPVGTVVRLSNGQKAVVIDNNHVLRPTLKVLKTGAKLDLHRDFNCLNLTIKNILFFGT